MRIESFRIIMEVPSSPSQDLHHNRRKGSCQSRRRSRQMVLSRLSHSLACCFQPDKVNIKVKVWVWQTPTSPLAKWVKLWRGATVLIVSPHLTLIPSISCDLSHQSRESKYKSHACMTSRKRTRQLTRRNGITCGMSQRVFYISSVNGPMSHHDSLQIWTWEFFLKSRLLPKN